MTHFRPPKMTHLRTLQRPHPSTLDPYVLLARTKDPGPLHRDLRPSRSRTPDLTPSGDPKYDPKMTHFRTPEWTQNRSKKGVSDWAHLLYPRLEGFPGVARIDQNGPKPSRLVWTPKMIKKWMCA